MNVIHTLLAGFFDYAGLYPPAGLSLRSAVNHYLEYARGKHAWALGRLIVNAERLEELRSAAGGHLAELKLSVIVPDLQSFDAVLGEIERGTPIESLEIKCEEPAMIERIAAKIPSALTLYTEIPLEPTGMAAVNAISRTRMRAKIRMGGVVAEAIPQASNVTQMLDELARLRLTFKATAGLHHPIRSSQPLTYERQSARATMHGFVNLLCAAAMLYFGGEKTDAERVLGDEDHTAWRADECALEWRHVRWSRDQLAELRRKFLVSIGSCSFEEPMQDLEALGWL